MKIGEKMRRWRRGEMKKKQSERLSLGQPLKATGDYTPQMSRRQV